MEPIQQLRGKNGQAVLGSNDCIYIYRKGWFGRLYHFFVSGLTEFPVRAIRLIEIVEPGLMRGFIKFHTHTGTVCIWLTNSKMLQEAYLLRDSVYSVQNRNTAALPESGD